MAGNRVIFAYVDGSELADVCDALSHAFEAFVATQGWSVLEARVVDFVDDDDPTLRPGDLPDWHLGLNLIVPRDASSRDVETDLRAVVDLLQSLHTTFGRDFAVGVDGEDLAYVDGRKPTDSIVSFVLACVVNTDGRSPTPR